MGDRTGSILRGVSDCAGSLEASLINSESSGSSSVKSSNDSWMQAPQNKNAFTSILINARSLKNKMVSFNKILNEMTADVCLVTETWLKNENEINCMLEDFTSRTPYGFLRKDRGAGKRGGGIAIFYNKEKIQLSKAKIPPTKHEVHAAIGRRTGQRRKIAVVVLYVPPWYNADQNRSFYAYINDVIMSIKSKYDNPMILIGGDFNRREHKQCVHDYPEIKPVITGPTRGDAVLDIIMSNFNELLVDSGVAPPILSDDGTATDHNTVFTTFRIQRVPSYSIQEYSYQRKALKPSADGY